MSSLEFPLWTIAQIGDEFCAAFLGVLFTFRLDRQLENRRFNNRVREIVPYVYLKFRQNLSFIDEWHFTPEQFVQSSKRFETSHWEMFKGELGKWRPINVVPLTRTYYPLDRANRLLNQGAGPRDSEVGMATDIARRLIELQIERYKEWFRKNPKNQQAFERVKKEYEIASKWDLDARKAIEPSA